MTVLVNYVEVLGEQMSKTRTRDGVWERLQDGEWATWPVLRLDRLARLEVVRCHGRPRTAAA